MLQRTPTLWARLALIAAMGAVSAGRVGRSRAEAPTPAKPPTNAPVGPKVAPDCRCGLPQGEKGSKRYTRQVAKYRVPEVPVIDAEGAETPLPSVLDRDGPVVLQFVFTTCPTICGALSGTLSAVQTLLGDELSGASLVSISIDPEHDRPEQLRRYAQGLKAGKNWRFFTGSSKDIASIQRAFDAYQVNKMEHQPLTFLRAKKGEPWVRITGLPGAADLAAEYRKVVKP